MPNFDQTRIQTITTSSCSKKSFYSQVVAFFEDPVTFL